jgi:hypothetical protein
VSPADELRLRETVESVLDGTWCVTVSRSHLDGQWHLQVQGTEESWRVVVPAFNEQGMHQLSEELLRNGASVSA